MNDIVSAGAWPELPSLARRSFACLPLPFKVRAITSAINGMFATQLRRGDLDFLAERVVNIHVTDADFGFSITRASNRLRATNKVSEADVDIEGSVYAFLLLATRKEDADTLFFRRHLKTTGDTELGLQIKNFLDGLELDNLPFQRPVDAALRLSVTIAEQVGKLQNRFSGFRRFN